MCIRDRTYVEDSFNAEDSNLIRLTSVADNKKKLTITVGNLGTDSSTLDVYKRQVEIPVVMGHVGRQENAHVLFDGSLEIGRAHV